jgi:hypothetical protein
MSRVGNSTRIQGVHSKYWKMSFLFLLVLTTASEARAQVRNHNFYGEVPRPTQEIGLLYFKGDGGDPNALRLDGDGFIICVASRDGGGRFFQSGREVQINPAVQESVRQIAKSQFGPFAMTATPMALLPNSAQRVLAQLRIGPPFRVVFSHAVNRVDAGKASENLAAKILAMENSSRDADRPHMLELVRTVMRMYGLKSNACDNSTDNRCNRPGVREAFAQIKREEIAQGLPSPGS